jgi:hypothetical protein
MQVDSEKPMVPPPELEESEWADIADEILSERVQVMLTSSILLLAVL